MRLGDTKEENGNRQGFFFGLKGEEQTYPETLPPWRKTSILSPPLPSP